MATSRLPKLPYHPGAATFKAPAFLHRGYSSAAAGPDRVLPGCRYGG